MQELEVIADLLKAIPAATVGGREISLSELLYAMKVQGELLGPLERALGSVVLLEAADREGIRPTLDELEAETAAVRRELGLLDDAELRRWLRRGALSIEDFESSVRRRATVAKLRAKVVGPLIEPYFEAHRRDLPYDRLDKRARDAVAEIVWQRWVDDELERRHALVVLPSILTEA